MAVSTAKIANRASYQWGSLALFMSAAAILTALGFEYLAGYEPCELCLQQRYAYYATVPLLFATLIVLSAGQATAATALFFLASLMFLANGGLGVYHAGIEWNFWTGPASCSGGALKPLATGSLMKELTAKPVVACGLVQGRFLGLSFAGWNVIASIALVIATLKAASAASSSRF